MHLWIDRSMDQQICKLMDQWFCSRSLERRNCQSDIAILVKLQIDGAVDHQILNLQICGLVGRQIGGSVGQWISRSLDLWICRSVDQWIGRLVDLQMCGSLDRSLDLSELCQIGGSEDGWIDGSLDWVDWQIARTVDLQINGSLDGQSAGLVGP